MIMCGRLLFLGLFVMTAYRLILPMELEKGTYYDLIKQYKGTEINPQTIAQLAAQEAPLAPNLEKEVKLWSLSKNELLTAACTLKSRCKWQKNYTKQISKLKQNFELEDGHNWVFPVNFDSKKYYVKISSYFTRMMNLAACAHETCVFKNIEEFTQEELERFEIVPTYQSASRVANYLKMNETCKKHVMRDFGAAPTHLVYLPDRPQNDPNDNNVIVLQEEVKGLQGLTFEHIQHLPKNQIENLFYAIKELCLWDVRINIHGILGREYEVLQIMFCDIEQPWQSSPRWFLNKNKTLVDMGVDNGLYRLGEFVMLNNIHYKKTDQWNHLRSLIMNDHDVMQNEYSDMLRRLFN